MRQRKTLIGITGPAGSGKSTVAEMMLNRGIPFVELARPIKSGLCAMFGVAEDMFDFDKEKEFVCGVTKRELIQTLGTEWGRRMISEDLWIQVAIKRIEAMHSPTVVIPDIRYENEAAWVRRNGFIVRLTRPGAQVREHSSEDGIQHDARDFVLDNDCSLGELQDRVDGALRAFHIPGF